MFDVSRFPAVPASESLTLFEDRPPVTSGKDVGVGPINSVDLEEQFRAVMRKLAYCGSALGKLPEGCSFTIAIELKEKAEKPIGVRKVYDPFQTLYTKTIYCSILSPGFHHSLACSILLQMTLINLEGTLVESRPPQSGMSLLARSI